MGSPHEKNDEKRRKHIVALLERLIDRGSSKQLYLFFKKYHEADIADALIELSKEHRTRFFSKVKPEIASEVLEAMDLSQQLQFIEDFKTDKVARFIDGMETDDAADLLEELFDQDPDRAAKILNSLPPKTAKQLRRLLTHIKDSAGAIMTLEFLSIPENLNVQEAIQHVKKQDPPDSEISFYIFIVDNEKKLLGYTTLRDLLLSAPSTKVVDIRNDYPITVHIDMDQEETALLIRKYDLLAIPVVDDQNHLMGLVTVDDIVDVVVEEATEDLYKLSGTSEIDEAKLLSGKIIYAIRSRLPWLVLTIFGGILASYIITVYSDFYSARLFSLALSLSFVPLLMGLGGNIGNQSATIIVRGISTGFIRHKHPVRFVFREVAIGFLIGLFISTLLFIINVLMKQTALFSFIVSLSLLINMTVAALIGASLPVILQKCNVDPAVASAPFISTTLDIIGQLIYFTLTILTLSLMSR